MSRRRTSPLSAPASDDPLAVRQFSAPHGEPRLPRHQRRARGIYYTPPEIVEQVVELTLSPRCPSRGESRLRILDPACGAGEFLAAAGQRLLQHLAPAEARGSLFGIDCDPTAVATARERLQSLGQIVQADALTDRTFPDESFDVILGNPPYVNIRQLAKTSSPARAAALRERFRTARGNFDLYVLFIERALELLKPGGRCGLVIPNKWATLDYARPLRELLLAETTIDHVVDLSSVRVFREASVYPHLLVFKKTPASDSHCLQFHDQVQPRVVRQASLSPTAFAFTSSLDVESRVATVPLGQLATLSCGTAGYSAQRIAEALIDVGQAASLPSAERQAGSLSHADFITSGNIDRYAIQPGNVRYLKRTYLRPVLPLDASGVTARQRRLFGSEKIVIAGISQRLEAAWDDRGLALGVQVFAVNEPKVDLHYLLVILNSKLLTYLFRTRFAAKQLAGGYLAINKGQLARLPIAIPRRTSVSLVQNLEQPRESGRLSCEEDAEIDRQVYRLYRLTEAEIATIEDHFAELGRRAA